MAALAAATLTTAASAATITQKVTDTFTATATTGQGQASPVEVNPSTVTVRADGAIGLGYTYAANGRAFGQLPGSVSYEEHGYLYFTNPANPASYVGSSFTSGVFTLRPEGPHVQSPVVIADTNPAGYRSGTATLDLGKQYAGRLPASASGPLAYGWFTFTGPYGVSTGYATQDFRHFAITLAFNVTRSQ